MSERKTFEEFERFYEEVGLASDMRKIAREFNVTFEMIYSDSKLKSVALARAECWFWLWTNTYKSTSEIATEWGRDNHTLYWSLRRTRARKGINLPPKPNKSVPSRHGEKAAPEPRSILFGERTPRERARSRRKK